MYNNQHLSIVQTNPYDLSAIAGICKKYKEIKSHSVVPKPPYEPERFCSAYDLSKRPGSNI